MPRTSPPRPSRSPGASSTPIPAAEPLPWLYAVARRVLANHRRGIGRRERLAALLRVEDVATPMRAGEDRDGPAFAALATLSPADQELLRLVAWEELGNQQIAAVLGITPNAVAIRLHRARARFADALARTRDDDDLKYPGPTRTSADVKGTHGADMERSSGMSMPTGPDPIDRLRAADPVHADDVPDASLARVIGEDPGAHRDRQAIRPHQAAADPRPARRDRRARPRGRHRARDRPRVRPWRTSARGRPCRGRPDAIQHPSENPAAGGGVASCLAYDPANLPTFDIVFDGTVTAVDGDQVTFDVNEGWKGADGSITLTAPQVDVALVGPMPDFQVGGRYLVSAAGSTHQRVQLHARLRRRHGGRLGSSLRRLTRPSAARTRPRRLAGPRHVPKNCAVR